MERVARTGRLRGPLLIALACALLSAGAAAHAGGLLDLGRRSARSGAAHEAALGVRCFLFLVRAAGRVRPRCRGAIATPARADRDAGGLVLLAPRHPRRHGRSLTRASSRSRRLVPLRRRAAAWCVGAAATRSG